MSTARSIELIDGIEAFEMPDLWIGTEVEVATNPHLVKPDWGIVVTAKDRSADIWFHGSGAGQWRQGPLEDCWYEGDPRIISNPGIINAEERRGVFRLSVREVAMRAAGGRLSALESALEALIRRLSGVEGEVDSKGMTALVKRVAAIEKAIKG